LGQLVILALQHELNLKSVWSYPLGPVPWAVATSDAALLETDKAKLMHSLEDKSHLAQRPSEGSDCCVVDGNALLQAMVFLPSTFGGGNEELQSWKKLVETNAISERISQFPCMETPTIL